MNAPLGEISGAAIDSHGNIFLADSSNSLVLKITPGGMLSVYAGNGKKGHSGDNGPAINASINPTDVAVDAKGNLYIQDQAYIRMVTPGGLISTIAGNGSYSYSGDGGPAANATINALSGIITDAGGTLYFADTANNCVRKIANGVISTYAGKCGSGGYSGDGGPAAAARLMEPKGLAFDSFGNLYIGDSANEAVREVSNGTISTLIKSGLVSPTNLAMDANANLYISDTGANLVFRYSLNSKTLSDYAGTAAPAGAFGGDGGSAGQARLKDPAGLAVDASGDLFIADVGNYRLREVTPPSLKIATAAGNGAFSYGGDGGQAINAQLNGPTGIALDSAGNLYFADTGNNRIRMMTQAGVISTFAGNGLPGNAGDNGNALNASLNAPTDVALDGSGNLYIADAGNELIRKVVLATGTITTFAGGGTASQDGVPAVSANLLAPVAVAVDAVGNVYIAEAGFNKVAVVTAKDGKINTFAGQVTGFPGYTGDGSAALGAALNSPEALAFDSAGNLYIADTDNNVVRKVSAANGYISTVAGMYTPPGAPLAPEIDNVAATSSGLFLPHAVAVDSKGNLYIAEFDGKIRQVATGTIQTVAGGGSPTVLGDGGPPTAAGINGPEGLSIDGSGNVLIADTGNDRIRKVIGGDQIGTPPPLPTYQISASSLTFTQPFSGAIVPPQGINLTPTANGATAAVNGLDFTAATDAGSSAWLSVDPISGSMPASLMVTANAAVLPPCTNPSGCSYTGTITITAPGTVSPTANIPVNLTIPQQPPQPALGLDTQNLTFTAAQNSAPLTNQFHVLNTGGGTLSFTTTVTSSQGAWLNLAPSSGSATPNGPVAVSVTATPANLTPGTYTGSIVIAGAGSTATIPVTMTVSGPAATMLVSESAITFTAVAGGGVPLPHNFGILNIGSGTMDWQATASTLVNGALVKGSSWLQVSQASGTVQQPYLDVAPINVTVDPSNLQAGTYYGRITVNSAAAVNNPQLITVMVNVIPAGLNPGPEVYPTGLVFTGVAGATPGSQTVQVSNPGNVANSFQSGTIGNFFSILPLNAAIGSTQPTTIEVYPDLSNVSAGSQQRGTLTLQFSDGSPAQSVNMLVVVAPAGSTSDADPIAGSHGRAVQPRDGSSCSPLQIVFSTIQSGFTAVVGQSTNIEAKVTDACGNPVGPNGESAKVICFFTTGANNTTNINMSHIGSGIWQGTWTPTGAGSVTVHVEAAESNGNTVTGTSTALTGTVTAVAPKLPSSTPGTPFTSAVSHAASQAVGLPIAPGELITVYGGNLADSPSTSITLPLPTQSEGLQVLLGVTPLPILYTSSGQMNVQVPYSVPKNTQYQLSVVTPTGLSVPQTLNVADAAPGIFTANQDGTGQGAIVKSDGITLAQAGTPASIGETVTIYCTGLGIVNPPAVEGVAPTGQANTVNPVTATIGGVNASVSYAGVTPGDPGLYQVNAVVPSGIATGDSVPVQITIAGQSSQTVTMSVH